MRPWRREISEKQSGLPVSGYEETLESALRMAKYADSMPLYEIVETIKKTDGEKDNMMILRYLFFMVPRCSAL